MDAYSARPSRCSVLRIGRQPLVAGLFSLALALTWFPPPAASASAPLDQFCAHIVRDIAAPLPLHPIWASSGLQMQCFGPQSTRGNGTSNGSAFGSNVDAANPKEDVTPSGVQVFGQSETSIASVGPYVVEAWNDATGLIAPCGSQMFKEEVTSYGFSADGGASFNDEGGLRNDNCATSKLLGDPSVEAWQPGGTAYFYVGSLYNFNGLSAVSVSACNASGSGASASIACTDPFNVATGAATNTSVDFLDKPFMSIDPARGRLYLSFTRFTFDFANFVILSQIELAVCDIGTPSGGTSPSGGTAGMPVCFPGLSPAPYLVVAPPDPQGCENQGAYPGVDVTTGDVYVGWEFNWGTNLNNCTSQPTQNRVAFVPFACLTPTPVSPCVTTPSTRGVNVFSLAAATIPGYNRFPMQDFPRIAVSPPKGTVSIVWNDTREHATGDIFLQSFALKSLTPLQLTPVRVNPAPVLPEWHFMPALRQADANGNLNVSYYEQRDTATCTSCTDTFAVLNLSPLTMSSGDSVRVTNVTSNWVGTSSDIVPNFGDYTDNYVRATPGNPYNDCQLFVAWSDGRLSFPNPFEARLGSCAPAD